MSRSVAAAHEGVQPQDLVITGSLLWLMAAAAGLGGASIYYNQPLLEQMRDAFGSSIETLGWIPALTQIGYAAGMLLLVPLGDMFQRRTLIVLFTLRGAAGACSISLAPSVEILCAVSFIFGVVSITPQLLVPFAAYLAPADQKGRVVGFMVSGILAGILLARAVSGFIGAALGWRMMFALAALVPVVLALALAKALPRVAPTYKGSYAGLLATV